MDELDLGATIRGFSAGQRIFKRYTLQRQLGRGGMGVVWLARDEELGRDTALKFLPEVVATDRAAIADMKREVRRAIDLAHPHIVKIHDFVTDGHMAAVSMEHVAGDTLSALRVDQPGQLFSTGKLAPWVAQLCSALDYAHGTGEVVHRDLKPVNLMVNQRGDLKVLDFGIAASLSESVTRVSKQAGSSGTPVYMSPQQMMGGDPAVTDDVYALGATLYELLTGKPPFFSGNILIQVQSKVPALVNERRKVNGSEAEPVPAAWEETIAACLAKEPQDRPQSVGEVAERLGVGPAMPAARPVSGGIATKSTRNEKTESPTLSPKTPLFAGLAVAVIVVAGLGWYFGIHAPEQRRLAEEKRVVEMEQAKAAAVEKKRQEAEAAREKSESEQIIARIAAMTDDASAEERKLTGEAVDQYVRNWPPAVHAGVKQQWQSRLSAWEAVQQRRAQEETERIARAAAAREKSEMERIIARIAAMTDDASAEERKLTGEAVDQYVRNWPPAVHAGVKQQWQSRLSAWEAVQQRRAQEETERIARAEAAREKSELERISARIAAMADSATAEERKAVENAVNEYGQAWPVLFNREVRPAWQTRLAAWETAQQRRAQEEAVRVAQEEAARVAREAAAREAQQLWDQRSIALARDAIAFAKPKVAAVKSQMAAENVAGMWGGLASGLVSGISADSAYPEWQKLNDRSVSLMKEAGETRSDGIMLARETMSMAGRMTALLMVRQRSKLLKNLQDLPEVLQREVAEIRAANATTGPAVDRWGDLARDIEQLEPRLQVLSSTQPAASAVNIVATELLPGVEVVPLTPELRKSHGIDDRLSGFLITGVAETSPNKASLVVGAVLEQINRVPVTDFNSAKNALKTGRNLALVYYNGTYRYVTFFNP